MDKETAAMTSIEMVTIPKAKAICNSNLADDMMTFEECINMIGVETRRLDDDDQFRNFWDIIRDIGIVCKNNPTLLDDIEGKDFRTGDEQYEFLRHYNFDGVTVILSLREGK